MGSPSSSTSSANSSSLPIPNVASLPVAALRGKIVEKITENRVTLIVGETGCGSLPFLCFLYSVTLLYIIVFYFTF